MRQNFKIFVKNSTIWIATNDTISLVTESESNLDEVASSIQVNILQRQVWIDDLQIIYQSLYSNINVINL